MEPNELLAKATIAAALIASHAVDMAQLPKPGTPDVATKHLRELPEYVYAAIIGTTAR